MKAKHVDTDGPPDYFYYDEDYSEEAANTAWGLLISCVTFLLTLAGIIYGICSLIN